MKRILAMVASASLVLGLAGCSELNDRVDQLETDVKSLQDGIDKLQKAVDAKLTITGVTPTENGNTVTFSDGSTLTINDGKDGDTLIGSIKVDSGYAYITLADGTSFYFPVYSPVGAVKSISFIPEYSDGKGTIDKNGLADFHFQILPESAVKGLKEAYDKKELTLLVNTTEIKTRDGEGEEINPVIKFEEDAGMFTIEGLSFKEDEGTEIAVSIGFEDQFTAISSEYIPMVWEGYVELAGVRYSTREMKDGKVWMTENLRYIPEGYTPCDDMTNVTAGVYYPLTLNTAENGMVFSQNTYVIEEQGYLYQSEVALGLKVGDIQDEEKAKSLEGVQGICPEGWHIPTADDIMGLVGKAVPPYVTNEDAPYYDKVKKDSSIELLNADGFNCHPYGAVAIATMSTKKAPLMGYRTTNPGKISTGY